MTLVHTTMGDVGEMRRTADQLANLANEVPSLKRYAELAEMACALTREEDFTLPSPAARDDLHAMIDQGVTFVRTCAPRSMIGWGAIGGYCARALNIVHRHDEALSLCDDVLRHLDDSDLDYVALYLNLQLERCVALAHTGKAEQARAELDALLKRHQESTNPLTHGRLREAYARVFAAIGDWRAFREQLERARHWYEQTTSAPLFARIEALRNLDPTFSLGSARAPTATLRTSPAQLGVRLPREEEIAARGTEDEPPKRRP
jgi:tetratricopeptide (TPR) repeat protein